MLFSVFVLVNRIEDYFIDDRSVYSKTLPLTVRAKLDLSTNNKICVYRASNQKLFWLQNFHFTYTFYIEINVIQFELCLYILYECIYCRFSNNRSILPWIRNIFLFLLSFSNVVSYMRCVFQWLITNFCHILSSCDAIWLWLRILVT